MLLAFIPALINWGIAVYVYSRLPRNATSYVFGLFVVSLALWQTNDAIMRISASLHTALLWYGLLSFGVFLIVPFGMHFILFFTDKDRFAYSPFIIFLLYLPAIIFELFERSGLIKGSLPTVSTPFWGYVPMYTQSGLIEGIWIAGFAIAVSVMLFSYALRIWHIPQKRIQTLLIAIGFAIPTVQGTITQIIFPYILHLAPIPISSTVMSTFSIATLIAFTRFQFLQINPSVAARVIVKTITDMLVIATSEEKLTFINSTTEKLLGLKKDYVSSFTLRDLFPKETEDYKLFQEHVLTSLIHGKQIPSFISSFTTISGSTIPVLLSASPIPLDRKIKPGILLVAHDITHQKQMEERLQHAMENLKNTNHELEEEKAVFTSIGDGVIATDREGKITFINRTAQELLGLENEVLHKQFSEVISMEDEKGNGKKPMDLALQTAQKISSSNYLYIKNDGTKLPVSVTITPIILKGRVMGMLNIFRDISKEKEIDRAKTEFVSLASHELRSPPTTIKWYAELLLQRTAGPITDRQKIYLEQIYAASQRMIDLTNTLLNVSRIELGTLTITKEVVSIIEVLKHVMQGFQSQIAKKKLHLQEEYDTNIPSIQTDKKLLELIFQNLLSNAIKYTDKEGYITVVVRRDLTGTIRVKVHDTGYGIPLNQQSKIFTKLFRADNIRLQDPKGSGLGLYLVKSIIDRIGWKIWFTSEENKGTTFSVIIPTVDIYGKK